MPNVIDDPAAAEYTYTFEFTWPQLRSSLHDGMRTTQLAELLDSCESTQDTVTFTVISLGGGTQ